MKIVFLARRFSPDIGGVEKHVYEISKILTKKGHKVIVITQSQGKKNDPEGIRVVRIDKFPKNTSEKLQIWKWMFVNRKLFREVDVIHSHDVFFWYLPIKLMFLSKKSFITFHGYENYPISKKALVIRKLSEYLSNGNIIVGDFIKKWYGTKPDFVIYGGVEVPKQIEKPKNVNSAVFIGRLDRHTGILDYVKAVNLIRKDNPKFEFVIVGDGEYKKRLGSYKPLGFRENSVDYLRQYSFAFVSRYLSILEALANKKLVFALYDNPVKEDYLKMTPFSKFVLTTDSAEKLAEKVGYFLDNPKEIDKFTNQGYEWVKDQTWENVVNTYLKLWRKT